LAKLEKGAGGVMKGCRRGQPFGALKLIRSKAIRIYRGGRRTDEVARKARGTKVLCHQHEPGKERGVGGVQRDIQKQDEPKRRNDSYKN